MGRCLKCLVLGKVSNLFSSGLPGIVYGYNCSRGHCHIQVIVWAGSVMELEQVTRASKDDGRWRRAVVLHCGQGLMFVCSCGQSRDFDFFCALHDGVLRWSMLRRL